MGSDPQLVDRNLVQEGVVKEGEDAAPSFFAPFGIPRVLPVV